MAKRRPRQQRGRRRVTSTAPRKKSAVVTLRYIESSALLAALLEQDASALESIQGNERLVTSALTMAESARAIIRARVAGRLTVSQEQAAIQGLGTFERRCFVVDVTHAVLTRVGRPFPLEPIRTLDAVHLATAELLDERPQLITIVTRDSRVKENARALGFSVE